MELFYYLLVYTYHTLNKKIELIDVIYNGKEISIDTSSEICGVALLEDDRLIDDKRDPIPTKNPNKCRKCRFQSYCEEKAI